MNGVLPPLLVAAAFALTNAGGTFRARGLVVFVAVAAIVACVPMSPMRADAAYLACWISIIACGAAMYVPGALRPRVAIALAVGAGAAAGAVIATADAPATLAFVPPVVVVTALAAQAAAARVPIASKVVASWLIAVALLAALLRMLPVTPGYLPDHLE